MKIFTAAQIKEIDASTLMRQSISESSLIKRVAGEIINRLDTQYLSNFREIYLFAGTGNNGNDAIAAANLLHERGFPCELYIIQPEVSGTDILTGRKGISDSRREILEEYYKTTKREPERIEQPEDIPSIPDGCLVIDGIFGTGLNRPPSGIFLEVIKSINASFATVVSIDLPSGLICDNPELNVADTIIKATRTITLEIPKLPLFLKESYEFTGIWEIIDIGLDKQAIREQDTTYYMIDKDVVHLIIKQRKKHSHKGNYGHALLLAGSRGMAGAATLAARGVLRAGAGLLTLYVRPELLSIFQISVPEAICSIMESDRGRLNIKIDKYNAAAIGPGLGLTSFSTDLLDDFIGRFRMPAIFDADAINIIATQRAMLERLPENSILTPHPGEFSRLAGSSNTSLEALQKQLDFSRRYKVFVVLKGAFTSLSTPSGEVWFNSTGNPGMATAGSGDLLTGVILGLLAQGYSSKESALAGIYLHSLAGDLAANEIGEESLITSDIADYLSAAFRKVKTDNKFLMIE